LKKLRRKGINTKELFTIFSERLFSFVNFICLRRKSDNITRNCTQAQFGFFIELKQFSIIGVHGKLKILGHQSGTAACQQNAIAEGDSDVI
jgi:hypothetical protein